MLSKKNNILLHLFLLIIYTVQVFSDFFLLIDSDKIYTINRFINIYVILNLAIDVLFFIYLIFKMNILLKKYIDYERDNENYCSFLDYCFYILLSILYFVFIIVFYTYKIPKNEKDKLMDNQYFKLYFYSLIPIATTFITLNILFFSIGLIIMCYLIFIKDCLICDDTNNRIYPN